jgi:hypothetical protein
LLWLIVLVGFAAMYLPTYWWAANDIWQTDEHGHGAIILLVVIWLFWQARVGILAVKPKPAAWMGWPCFIARAAGLRIWAAHRTFRFSRSVRRYW